MPRGNDPDAAAEFEKEYGVQGNAEGLIKSQRASYSRELRAASLGRLDPVATNALDLDKVESALENDDEQVVSAAVRGGYVVAVVEDEEGRTTKRVISREDAGIDDKSMDESRETLGLPAVPIGESAQRGSTRTVEAAREADEEERERLAKREEGRAARQKEEREAAEKERDSSDDSTEAPASKKSGKKAS